MKSSIRSTAGAVIHDDIFGVARLLKAANRRRYCVFGKHSSSIMVEKLSCFSAFSLCITSHIGTMVQAKKVRRLRELCIASFPEWVSKLIKRYVSKAAASQWLSALDGEARSNVHEMLSQQIGAFKTFFYSHITCYDYEDTVQALMAAVDVALSKAKSEWTTSINMSEYLQEIDHLAEFMDLVCWPYLHTLDMRWVPRSLRSGMVQRLGNFQHLRVLIIGSQAGGQWLYGGMVEQIAAAMAPLSQLQHFSMKHDCRPCIVQMLSHSCPHTLKVLDLENCKLIDDECLNYLILFNNMEELNVFQTSLGDESLARIIMNLPHLKFLPKGDFLCDALGWIDYLEEMDQPIFQIRNFFPSQNYYFHEEWQLELASRMCPNISQMLFIYHERYVANYLALMPFQNLTDVDLYGGSFYTDKLLDLLQMRGAQLTKLKLISVKELDYKAIASISLLCGGLTSLAFNHCDMIEFTYNGDPNSDDEYERRQAFLAMAKEAFETMQPMDSLESLSLLSACPQIHARMLISYAPNLKRIHLGSRTEVDDATIERLFSRNGLQALEEFQCDGTSRLSMATINLLMTRCDHLRCIGDLQNWSAVQSAQIGHLYQLVHDRNLDLELQSHRQIRKYLEMRDFERKTYMNLVVGPSKERIRIAGQMPSE